MSKTIKLDLSRSQIISQDLNAFSEELAALKKKLWSGEEDFTGWVKLPYEYNKNELKRILATAEKIRKQCLVLVVIGIGGSYLGARAVISALADGADSAPEICYAGQNLSGTYHKELLKKIRDKEFCLCVISKSGTTTEPSVAFSILKDELYKKYGREEAAKRIYAITDAEKGVLRQEADREGYESFVVPDDIGGRYSVLTAVGLLPIAAAGIDIEKLLLGAESIADKTSPVIEEDGEAKTLQTDEAALLAAARVSLLNRGKTVEVYEYYEPKLQYFTEWLKQLFGESEGKDGKGIFPASLQFSTDLHSMGQFLQDGNQIFFETVLDVSNPPGDLIVPESAGELLAGMSMNAVNQAAVQGVIAAHEEAGIPIIKLDIPELTPYCFGQLIYFFETSCALSGYLMGVNPFDQPGVESYKAEMKKVLKNR
ncbi:MAG: glucose-6-phosphate isomerase [Eubacteriales bacterium]|nr:glucose-6-phosphate isomerase [Eubacteriales bacterium]MDD3200042.1 glucose-6-phosphate isomerase [Eubacteriales bacterium]MDD4630025.1 glucose-6-phosphate isomerase [Eubacteriales bacterium]